MPLYEYECEECGEIREVVQKFSDAPLTICSRCCGKLHKLISSNSFHLKGSGWYVTDYVSSPAKQSTTTPSSCDDKTGKDKASSKPKNGSN